MGERLKEAIPFFISLALLMAGIMVGKTYDLLSIKEFLIGGLLVSILILGTVAIVGQFIKGKVNAELYNVVTNLKNVTKFLTPQHNYIVDHLELLDLEKNTTCREIWICALDLTNDTSDSGLAVEIVKSNICRGIKYTFILPETDLIHGKLGALQELFKAKSQLLQIRLIPLADFKTISFAHVAIFNPNMAINNKVEAYMELPVEQVNVWIRISEAHTYDLIGRIKRTAKL